MTEVGVCVTIRIKCLGTETIWAGGKAVEEENSTKAVALLRRCGHILYHHIGEKRGQTRVLELLTEKKTLPQQQILEQLGVQPGSGSELLSKLEGRGLIERVRDEADNRLLYCPACCPRQPPRAGASDGAGSSGVRWKEGRTERRNADGAAGGSGAGRVEPAADQAAGRLGRKVRAVQAEKVRQGVKRGSCFRIVSQTL